MQRMPCLVVRGHVMHIDISYIYIFEHLYRITKILLTDVLRLYHGNTCP